MKTKILFIAMSLLLAVFPITSCQQESISAGSPAPDFELLSLESESISLSGLNGQPVMLNFWALSCPYCLSEMPYIQQAHNTYGDGEQGLAVLTINIRDSSSAINSFLKNHQYTFTVLHDTGARIASIYGVDGIPVTVFIDKDGIIQNVTIGAFPNWATLESKLAEII